ncbi:peptidase A22B, signal peptide peptidase, partial [Powellomyces hirtus]
MEPGLLVAYIALGVLAVIPIYVGSFGALKFPSQKRKSHRDGSDSEASEAESEEEEFFRLEDAYMFPVFGSAALLSLYLVFKYLNKEALNALFTAYFSILGVGAVAKASLQISRAVTGKKLKGEYRVDLWKKEKEIATYHFGAYHLFLLVVSLSIAGLYAMSKHWVLSNIYGEAFSVSAIQLLKLDSFKTGIALLAFLFFYDIFWVFGTDVMVTVAKSFDAPIKVLWPRNFWDMIAEGRFWNTEGMEFSLLGLGDIVIPGIFVALCLKFDHDQYLASPAGKKNKQSRSFPKPYFTSAFIAYVLGLITTVVVMHNFKAAQPALLYLSPACIFSVLLTGLARGELKHVLAYEPGSSSDK